MWFGKTGSDSGAAAVPAGKMAENPGSGDRRRIKTVLVTGGAGYVGSHTCVELLNDGYHVVVADNLSNSSEEALERVEKLTGRKLYFYEADLCKRSAIEEIFEEERIDAVIHCSGLKYVAESVINPLDYYYNNLTGTILLSSVMEKYGVRNMVFCSSGRVYGNSARVPLTEECPIGGNETPYGRIKVMAEYMLRDLHKADPRWNIMLMRFFNPVGAHPSGMIGESPSGTPNSLMPYIARVANGTLDCVGVFGNDYPTPDGTCIRDYIHVCDVAKGLVLALRRFESWNTEQEGEVCAYNLATGTGYSVLDVIHAYEKACGHPIPYEFRLRRPGDIPVIYASAEKAKRELGWTAEHTLEDMCADSYRWIQKNPHGFGN